MSDNKQGALLIVDDNQDHAFILMEYLVSFGYSVENVLDGISALEYINLHHPPIVFMDIQMPTMNGMEVTQHIRNNADHRIANTIIIGMSGLLSFDSHQRFLEHGVNEFITKPFHGKDLLSLLQKYFPSSNTP